MGPRQYEGSARLPGLDEAQQRSENRVDPRERPALRQRFRDRAVDLDLVLQDTMHEV